MPDAYQIVTAPPPRLKGKQGSYPFANMMIGQSFFVGKDEVSGIAVLNSACFRARKKYGADFRATQREDGSYQVYRRG